MEEELIKQKYIFLSLIVTLLISATSLFAQTIDKSLIEELQRGREVISKEESKETEMPLPEAEIFKAESLSTIEEMFKNRYFITNDRLKLVSLRDSLMVLFKAESLKIAIRGEYRLSDTLYFQLLKKLPKVEEKLDSTIVTLRQFGYNMFQVALPVIPSFTPVAEDYILGPGDEITIEVSGQMNESWDKIIDRDGKIVIPKVGQINIWGKTYREAKETIERALKKEFTNIEVSIALGELRSVNIFILGEVRRPGLYNISALSNPLSALFKAGGPKKSGSLRRIKYISNKGYSSTSDLYDILIEGKKLANIQLETGDIIYVPPIGGIVGVTGAVTRPGIFELNKSDDLSDILLMSGGMLPIGGTFRIQLERVSYGEKKVIEDFRFQSREEFRKKAHEIKIKNGDLIEAFEVPPIRRNYITISGNVERSGTYGLNEGMTILDLIREAGGLKKGTYLERAELLRFRGVRNPEIIEINLNKIMDENARENIELKEWDNLIVYSIDEIQEKFTVSISGAVIHPGVYPLSPDMTVDDLLFKGILMRTATEKAELFSIDPDYGVSIRTIELTDSAALNIVLKPNDHILVKMKPAYREVGYVSIIGEFTYPGTYPIKEGDIIKDVIERAGGFTKDAYLEGAKFSRKSVAELQNKAIQDLIRETRLRLLAEQRTTIEAGLSPEEVANRRQYLANQQAELTQLSKIETPGRVVIDLQDPAQLNMPLEDGDILTIPKLPKTVQVVGQVYNPTGITYEEGLSLKDYLSMSGGPKPTADKKRIYVRRASGKVVRNPDEIKPGDTIIIPEKVAVGKSFWEIAGIFATLIYQIGIGVAAFSVFVK